MYTKINKKKNCNFFLKKDIALGQAKITEKSYSALASILKPRNRKNDYAF